MTEDVANDRKWCALHGWVDEDHDFAHKHLAWAEGPECDPGCPGDWTDWHYGYIAGLERGLLTPTNDI